MISNENVVGQSIICNGIGIGEIIEVGPLHEGGEEFYKVAFPRDKCINYFSVNNSSKYRVLATKEIVLEAINVFKSHFDKIEYKSIQEKINNQKQMLKEEDIVKLAKTLSILNNEKELHTQITRPFKDSLNSFIDEIVFVLNIKLSEAYSILNMKVPQKKSKK